MYALCISFGLIRVSFDVQIESGEWMKEWRSGTSVIWWSVTLIWHRFYIYSMIDTLQKVSRWSLTNSIIKSRTPWYTSFFLLIYWKANIPWCVQHLLTNYLQKLPFLRWKTNRYRRPLFSPQMNDVGIMEAVYYYYCYFANIFWKKFELIGSVCVCVCEAYDCDCCLTLNE